MHGFFVLLWEQPSSILSLPGIYSTGLGKARTAKCGTIECVSPTDPSLQRETDQSDNYTISSRIDPLILVHDQKLFAVGGFPSSSSTATATAGPLVEMYEPKINEWEPWKPLPEPPFYVGRKLIYGTLENPKRILISPIVPREYSAIFYVYDVELSVWSCLGKRPIHRKCPIGWDGWGERAVTVVNTVYWVTSDVDLLAYNVEKDVWLQGSLKGFGISFVENKGLRLCAICT
ncbi:hypothetical protein FH972_016660 [Carpinus fangiana]|uniref:Uncharacterized protein n=1 Tax=Carpinus fangiana TaxID=176857 RepID=A0A5N6RGK0_9ROSI|nr:hypothetical protein FH972_016660 [Carpinus fangiana]